MATTEERMMIMGLCLQGILANPTLTGNMGNPMTMAEVEQQLEANVKLAHLYASKLMPEPEKTTAQLRVEIARVVVATWAAQGQTIEDMDDELSLALDLVTRFQAEPDSPTRYAKETIARAIATTWPQ